MNTVQITEARNLPGCEGGKLRAAEGVTLDLGDGSAGLLIEHAVIKEEDDGFAQVDVSVWGSEDWMLGIGLQPDSVVHVFGVDRELPPVPDRTGQTRVYGSWRTDD